MRSVEDSCAIAQVDNQRLANQAHNQDSLFIRTEGFSHSIEVSSSADQVRVQQKDALPVK